MQSEQETAQKERNPGKADPEGSPAVVLTTVFLILCGNSRIPYVHVPAARISMIVYIATAINTFLFVPMRKSILFIFALPEPVYKLVLTFLTLVTGGFRGRPLFGTYLLGVGCSFHFSIHLVPYLPGSYAHSNLV